MRRCCRQRRAGADDAGRMRRARRGQHAWRLLWQARARAASRWRAADYGLQHWRCTSVAEDDQAGSRDERKMTKATPRSRRASAAIQREMARRRMLAGGPEGDRRHHQPDPLRRGARVPPRRDGRADGRGQGRRTTWPQRIRDDRARARRADRRERRRWRARSTRRRGRRDDSRRRCSRRSPKCSRT